MIKVYLAGPDVFRNNTTEHFTHLKELALKYNINALSPFDNEIINSSSSEIFRANIGLINNVDVVIANINPFRGLCMDDGTAFEIAYAYSKGIPSYGYSNVNELTLLEFGSLNEKFDDPEYPIYEDFGNCCNLMIYESIKESGGNIFKTYEDCLKSIKDSLKSNKIEDSHDNFFGYNIRRIIKAFKK